MTETPSRPMVFIATPYFGGLVSQHYMQSVISLIQFASQANFDAALALLGHDSLITRSRNTLVSQFLDTREATHLLFIDADIGFEAAQVHAMLRFDQDFVAGIYPLKVINWSNPAIKRAAIAREPFQAAPLLYVGTLCAANEREREGRFATAIYCGGGFMLLKRQVIERMIVAYPESRYKSVACLFQRQERRKLRPFRLHDRQGNRGLCKRGLWLLPKMARHRRQDLARYGRQAYPHWLL